MKVLICIIATLFHLAHGMKAFNFNGGSAALNITNTKINCKLRYDIIDENNFKDLGRGLALGLFHHYN